MDEEQRPLLVDGISSEQNHQRGTRHKVQECLEGKSFHWIVIILITVDAICVLADLSYSFLTDECPPKHTEPLWLETLGHLSLAITSIFLAEIALALYAFGISFYNPLGTVIHASLHLLDAAVIIGTFVIEVFLRGRERELASLLILVRLWRLVKLVGGVAVGVGEAGEEAERRLAKVEHELADSKAEVGRLREIIVQNGWNERY